MTDIQYVGEHLWVHYTGHFLVLFAFFSAAFLGIITYQFYKKNDADKALWWSWLKIGFLAHTLSILGIISLLLFAMSKHYFEYQYVWAHVSEELPTRYILSAFWEGQEGSFLLWMFWNCVLGFLILRRKNIYTVSIIGILSIVQMVLMSMLLGVYFFGSKLGSNPFLLLRHTMDIPLFKNAEYTALIKGNGLNPLLQNYWMIIHPPTLFLGFASTVIPFCYVVSALFLKKYEEWLKPALSWALMSAGILGLGILMGGMWAYEALSFGGYWAWDPVENMSLVPWLVLIAALHAHLIAIHTKYSIRATIIFYILTFVLVVYSSFLTRSGILGDSSVHAFTQLGLEWQLLGFLILVTCIPTYFYIKQQKEIPAHKTEEKIASREFWMFIGSLILLFSAGLMTFTTSIPVFNKLIDVAGQIMNTSYASYHRSAPVDVMAHHNRFQVWIGVFIGIISAIAFMLRYLGTQLNGLQQGFWKKLISVIIISGLLTLATFSLFSNHSIPVICMLFTGWFAIFSNLYILTTIIKNSPKSATAIISHTGFGILLFGILFTGLNRKNIAPERFFQEDIIMGLDAENADKHFLLLKDQPKFAKGYWIHYRHDTMISKIRSYTVDFVKVDSSGAQLDSFRIYPQVQYDNKLIKVAASNPAIKHYLTKDIFTLVAQIPTVQMDANEAKKAEDSLQFESHPITLNDTVFGRKHYFILKELNDKFKPKDVQSEPEDQSLQAIIEVRSLNDSIVYIAKPGILFRSNLVYKFPYNVEKLGVRVQIPDSLYESMMPDINSLTFQSFELKEGQSHRINDDINITLTGFDKNPSSPLYSPKPDDISIAAKLNVQSKEKSLLLKPIYIIRDTKSFSIPDRSIWPGLTIQFNHINPDNGVMTFQYALHQPQTKIPIEFSENVARTDYIVMEAIEFPGINLVWLGSLMMVVGLMLSAVFRKTKP